MKSDSDVKRDVEAELKWSPQVDDTDVAVKVTDGEVTLTGFTRNYLERYQAESLTRRVKGVAAVANDIQVKPIADGPSDPEIARAALAALKLQLPLSWEKIKPIVKDGRISLEGTVEWHYQRERAESAVRHLKGVISVWNAIALKPNVAADNIKHKIEDAFRRIAEVDASHIKVEANGSEVTLRGEVRSWAERDQAQQSAWSAPGVTRVENSLTVRT
ncbi:MAG: BON domain-containing protein [Steroidobacteraceae bacterium]